AVFTHDRFDQEVAFKLAIKRINNDRIILPKTRLIPKIEHIQKHDSFHADKKVCGLLKTGVVAIFDPLEGLISRHLKSICDALDIPHLETRWDFSSKRDDLSVNLYPKPAVLSRAYVDIVKAWAWEQFAIIYEDNEGFIRLQDFFKEAESLNWRIKLHQFKPGKPYRETFWKVKNDGERNIILDVRNENIFRALKHAQQVGLITESHSYLITQLNLHTIDLEDFKFGKTKITAFKLIDDSNEEFKLLHEEWRKEFPKNQVPEISTESALIYDAVKLMSTAIQELDHGQSIEIQQVSCESSVPWSHGSSLINYMRPIEFSGVTGLVGFNDMGFRSSITLSVITVSPDGLEEIGTWSENADPAHRLNISRERNNFYSSSALENKTLIITTIINDPYTMIKDSSFKRIGNDQFEGYAIDLISELSKILHFNYEFRLVKDGAYGRPDKEGNWNGMMGELIRGEADLAVADLTITSKREDAVDFTHPFMNTGISILYKKPTKKVTSLFSFLSPFSNIVWIYVLCAYIGVSTMLFIVGRLSPYEWENPHPCRRNEQIVYPIENAEGLAAQEKIKYGCLGSGSTASFFSESNITTYKKMWNFMSKNPDVFMKSNEQGRKTVEKADGMYAYLMESASIEYTIERDCNLTQIGGLLDSKGYGIATHSPYRTPLSQAILKLQESGALLTLKERWWKQKKGGGKCIDDPKKSSGSVTPLKIDNVGGVFVVLLGGLSFSLLVVILEFVWKSQYEHNKQR
ncbi:glutamate receptor, ionotropic kainate-like protein 1, partial [Sarcoptes scabiei]